MAKTYHLPFRFVACAVCLAMVPLAPVLASPEADTREVNSYQLTETALARYGAATRALAPVLAGNPPGCDESDDGSLSALAARLDAVPGAPAALRGSGMSSREYVVFMLAAFQAGMGSWSLLEGSGELPSGVTPENVAFYQDHEVELQELAALMPRDPCDDEEEYEDDEGGWEESDERESDGYQD